MTKEDGFKYSISKLFLQVYKGCVTDPWEYDGYSGGAIKIGEDSPVFHIVLEEEKDGSLSIEFMSDDPLWPKYYVHKDKVIRTLVDPEAEDLYEPYMKGSEVMVEFQQLVDRLLDTYKKYSVFV